MDLQILSMSTPLLPKRVNLSRGRGRRADAAARPPSSLARSVGLSFGIVISGRTRIDFVAAIAATHLLRKGIGATTALVVTW